MGSTRARRYANHASGHKYKPGKEDKNKGLEYPYSSGSKNKGDIILEQEPEALISENARAAAVFKDYWFKAKDHPQHLKQKEAFQEKYYG